MILDKIEIYECIGGVSCGLIGISMCQKRTHAYFWVKLFLSNAQENTHVTITITQDWDKGICKKGRHFENQDMRSCLLEKYVTLQKSLVDIKGRKFSVSIDGRECSTRYLREINHTIGCYATKLCYSHKTSKNGYK